MSTRRASESPFPYGWPGRVTYFVTFADGPHQVTTRDEMREVVLAAMAGKGQPLFAAWPGQHRTDLFWIDKPQLLADALGLAVA